MLKKLNLLILASILVLPLILSPIKASAVTAVSITSPSSGEEITGTSFTVTGTATANRLITVDVDGLEIGSTQSDGSGNWSLEVTGQDAGAKMITATANAHYAYVTNSGDATISVIDTDTNEQVGSNISSGVNQSNLVVRPDNAQMVTAGGFGSADVRVWDLSDPAVPAITDSISSPHANTLGLAYTPDGSEFWAVSSAFNGTDNTVIAYDSSNPATTADIASFTGSVSISIAFNATGTKAYVSDCGTSAVHIIDVATKTQTGTIAGVGCGGIVIGPNDVAFLIDTTNDRVKPLNLAGETAGAFITVGDAPASMLFNTDGSLAYVTNTNSNDVSVINTGTDTVIDTLSLTGGPKAGIFSSTSNIAYVLRSTANEVAILDSDTFSELGTIAVGDTPIVIVAGPSESATATVDFTLVASAAESSDEVLADTGQNSYLYVVLATMLTLGSSSYLIRRYSRDKKLQ